ncbi:MAG: DUF1667 domain-containing protein [Oscillospiraceae bacterium]|nr:DUF1667 domain-containing protein [Oscillospiraceae bacterium]
MANIVCIVCPKGCRLTVDEQTYSVTGNGCERGAVYGKNELISPVRVLTSTVCITDADYRRIPVKTAGSIPKPMLMQAMEQLDTITLTAPVVCGQVVISNLLNTGIDVVATRTMQKASCCK